MRSTLFALSGSVALAFTGACGGMDTGGGDDDIVESTASFEIHSSDITLQPGDEFTKCYYFTYPNADKLAIAKWVSDLSPGSHHMIMFRSLTGDQPADGTVDDCNGGVAIPMYGTQVQHQELDFPDDDGFGKPLAQELQSGTKGYFQMHYFNSTDAPITAHVSIQAFALVPEIAEHVGNYTRTDLFATYNNDIAIPPHAMNLEVSATCPTIDANFWQMSTHSHKQSV